MGIASSTGVERGTAAGSFRDAVRSRMAVRAYVPTPVDDRTIRDVLEDANLAPSNCNTQPWFVHVVSGAARERLAAALCAAFDEERYSLDFSFDPDIYPGRLHERRVDQGRRFYEALSMGRDDVDGRRTATRKNLSFFGAPHAAFFFMPSIGDNVRTAADVGMYAQTFLLALAARGLAGIPQTMLGYFADTVREELGVPADLRLLFGASFGYADPGAPENSVRMSRDPIDDCVTFHP